MDAGAAWREYLDTLTWVKGNLDECSWCALLRAGSLGIHAVEAMDVVASRIQVAGGRVRAGKLRQQAIRAYEFSRREKIGAERFRPRPGYSPAPKPEFDVSKLERVAEPMKESVTPLWLAERSEYDPAAVESDGFLRLLYREGEKVLVFDKQFDQGKVLWPAGPPPAGGPDGVWFLAQPVDGAFHANPRQGTMSRRSEEAVTAWRFLVLESDEAPAKAWVAALVQLPLRISAIYTSGGRSIHALVRVDAGSKAEWDAECESMRRVLVTIGGCKGALSAVRLTRLPGCWRGEPRKRQRLLYLRPEAPMGPICDFRATDRVGAWIRWGANCGEDSAAALAGLRWYARWSPAAAKAADEVGKR
jgi:hypothetical protein